jgi:hypothetical protein
MSTLLHTRCDPYGAESEIFLAGGWHPQNMAGKIHWRCEERAESRYQLFCLGGDYGFTRTPGHGIVAAYHCDGSHPGRVMPLCRTHVREFCTWGYKPPKLLKRPWIDERGNEQWWQPGATIGGSRANECCPACLHGRGTPDYERIIGLEQRADAISQELARYEQLSQQLGLVVTSPEWVRLKSEEDAVRGHLDELNERGVIHKCPLRLTEVS